MGGVVSSLYNNLFDNNKNKHHIFLIIINSNNKIKCLLINSENDNEIQFIQLYQHQQEEYLPINILFDMNEIIINNQRKESIDFMNDLINNPDDFKEYQIKYQNKEYKVIAEVLFALIIHQYKKKIEKQFIIKETKLLFESPFLSNTQKVIKRINVSLDAIGLQINNYEFPDYDYQKQGEFLHEILEKYEVYSKYKNKLMKINISKSLIDNSKPFNEEEFDNEMKMKFNLEQRSQMKYHTLDNYCVFIASQYFNSITDHINLVKVSKRLRLNMEKFHYNPIKLNKSIRNYFPNIQTVYRYSRNDEIFEDDKKIIAIFNCKYQQYDLWLEEIEVLKRWTKLKCGEVIFDSNEDDWSVETSVFDSRILNRSKLVFIIEDTDNNKFGYYLNKTVNMFSMLTKNYDCVDYKTFQFSLESNGRIAYPIKYEIKDINYGGYVLFFQSEPKLIWLGNICLDKQGTNKRVFPHHFLSNSFNYHGIQKPLWENDDYDVKRIIVIQMK